MGEFLTQSCHSRQFLAMSIYIITDMVYFLNKNNTTKPYFRLDTGGNFNYNRSVFW